jgi:hypothetical protein
MSHHRRACPGDPEYEALRKNNRVADKPGHDSIEKLFNMTGNRCGVELSSNRSSSTHHGRANEPVCGAPRPAIC